MILNLQRLLNRLDDQTEYPINDRMSLCVSRTVSERPYTRRKNHILFRDTPTKAESIDELLQLFHLQLEKQGISQQCVDFIDEGDRIVYTDSAYSGEPIVQALLQTVGNRMHEKGYGNHTLTDAQKTSNRMKSKIWAHIELVVDS